MARSLLFTVVLIGLGGCQAPRLITSMTATNDQMKMVYSQAGGARTGIIQCARAADGALTNCKRMPIAFVEKKSGGAK